jgi:hypothetical protein
MLEEEHELSHGEVEEEDDINCFGMMLIPPP